MKTILITNTKNNTNHDNLKKIIIGDWCFEKYEGHKYINKYKLNIKSIQARKKCIEESLNLEEKILNKIIPILNNLHKERKSKKQWQIILGHWIRSYIRVFSNRYKHIFLILKKEKINYFNPIASSSHIYSNDIKDFLDNVRSINFNDEIYKKILEFNNSQTIFKKKLTHNRIFKDRGNTSIKDKIFQHFNKFFSKNDGIFISELYLDRIGEIWFHLKFKIFPRFWNYEKFYNYSKPNYYLRESTKEKLKISNEKNLKNFLLQNIFLYMPTAYLEDYSKIKEFNKNIFPIKPKTIITANTFYYNEAIKNYISSNLNNSKYIVIQHGNNYGSHFDEHFKAIEETTSDYFITWGFVKDKKHIKGVMQKKIFKNKNNINNLLIMHFPFELRDKIWDNYGDYAVHIIKIQKMLSKIKKIKKIKKIIYRVPNGEHYLKKILFLKKISKKIHFDNYKTKLSKNINSSNICVFNYNSSGFYENLSNNIPTLLFIDKSYLDEIDNNTKRDFLLLHKNNVIHFEIDKMYNFLDKNWINIDKWWHSNKVQKAIKIFTTNNAVYNPNPKEKLFSIIKNII